MSVYKLKSQTPVAIDPDRPAASIFSLQLVQPETRNIYIFDVLGSVEGCQLHSKACCMTRLYALCTSGFKKLPQTFMTEASYHHRYYSVLHNTQQAEF